MPANTICITRPGTFGNQYRVWRDDDRQWTVSWRGCHWTPVENTKESASALAVAKFSEDVMTEGKHNYRGVDPVPTHSDIYKALRGRNLACYCALCPRHEAAGGKPLNEPCPDCAPCHVDPLGEIANR